MRTAPPHAFGRLSFDVASVALAFLDLALRLPFSVGGEGASYFYFLFEFPLFVAPNITPVAFSGLDHRSLACLAFFLCWHLGPLFTVDRGRSLARLFRFRGNATRSHVPQTDFAAARGLTFGTGTTVPVVKPIVWQ
jgi:hypothetical protein